MPCAMARFERLRGGQVTFAVGKDTTYPHILGGNQVDRDSIPIDEARLAACRKPEAGQGRSPRFQRYSALRPTASRDETRI